MQGPVMAVFEKACVGTAAVGFITLLVGMVMLAAL